MKPAYRRLFTLLLLVLFAVAVAFIVIRFNSSSVPSAVEAQLYQGPWHFNVTASDPANSQVPLQIKVMRKGQIFSGGPLRVDVSALGQQNTSEVPQKVHSDGSGYATHASVQHLSAQILLSAGSSRRGGKALFALRSGQKTGPVSLYPLLSYRQPGGSILSVPFGGYIADVRVTPLASGANTVQVWLRATTQSPHFPASLQVLTTMLDMEMGTNAVTAQAIQPGFYVAQLKLSMAGLWRVQLQDGSSTADLALLAGSASKRTRVTNEPNGYHGPAIAANLPYVAFVTEMGAGQVALLNHGVAAAGQTPHGLDLVAHQPFLYVTDMGDNEVRVVDIRSGKSVAAIPVGLAPAHVVFTPNQHKAFVTDFLSADVSVIDVRRRKLIDRIPVGLNPHGIDITPDGRYIYVACAHGGGVWIIDARSNRVVGTVATGLEPYGLTMGPVGSGVAYVSDFTMNQVDVISLKGRRVTQRISVGKAPALMVVSADGRLYVANHDSNSVSAISLKTNRVVATIPVGDGPHGLDATPDGRYVYVANNLGNTVSVIETRNERVVETINVPGNPNEVALQQRHDLAP